MDRVIIDISLPLTPTLVVWPGSQTFQRKWIKLLANGDEVNESEITCNTHTGTHIDAPLHHLKTGDSIDKSNLSSMIGSAYVVDMCGKSQITAEELSKAHIPHHISRILLKTNNSEYWGKTLDGGVFDKNYVALTSDAAHWLVNRNIVLVGIDYLSIQKYNDTYDVHKALLSANVIIAEGLNLLNVPEGEYQFICLPLNVCGAEGAPARAVLIKEIK